ncbi:hypothetical protein PRIPAC_79081, partial [Pristionchus pacificus]|uniref:G protein-coupled receptor n=1 Tax=Pristionchus pacificus TaxID=54126 RepID=A0A2A6C3M8_PRIPA
MWYVRELLSVSYMGIIGTIGVILNLLLLRSVYRSTPPSMKVYSILIVNTAIVDLIGSLSTILTIPREQSSPFGIIVIFYGLGSMIDSRICCIFLGVFDIKQRTSTLITLLFTLGTAPIVFISCFFMRNRIVRELEKRKFLLSQTGHQLHRMLLDALRFQLLATSLLFISSAIFVISHFDIFYSSWMDFLQPA